MKKSKLKEYELEWEYESRIASEHLGSRLYSTTSRALCELITNSFDANASKVEIKLNENKLGGIDSITVIDNGCGISPDVLKQRFRKVGVDPQRNSIFGKLGIGRLAVLRIGHLSKWTSISGKGNKEKVQISFMLSDDLTKGLKIAESPVKKNALTGTWIEIYNLRDIDKTNITSNRIKSDLLKQFCSYLLANKNKKIIVDDSILDVECVITAEDKEIIPPFDEISTNTNISHLILNTPVDNTAFKNQIIFSSKGRTVTSCDPEERMNPNYLEIIDCQHLDDLISSNREALIQMDAGFAKLKKKAIECAKSFNDRYRINEKKCFIERARLKEYYPYKVTPDSIITSVKKDLYDVVLEKVHEQVNIESLTQKQQSVIFKLLKRVLESDDMLEVLNEIATLSDDDVEKFREVLERTTLTSIIRLSSEVTERLHFLDILHELTYGDISKYLKERSNLHKIIESNCWIFSSKYHLATSDKSFREIVKKHRAKAELSELDDKAIAEIKGVEDIPDLYLAAQRDYPINPKHHHLLVELKAPNVPLKRKEVEQVRRYAETILESHEFDKEGTFWDIFLVSSRVSNEIQKDRNQRNMEYGILWQWDNMNVWAFEWSEIINKAKEEMSLVKEHLEKKTKELSVSEYLRKDFPDILIDIENYMSLKETA